jgi:putative PIN family toxin of toxin-antitoxin system
VRIFLDTNVLVSAYRARGLCADLVELILTAPDYELITVNLGELKRILRSRFKVSKGVIETVERELREQTIIPKPSHPSKLPIRDPDDRWVLASAIEGKAHLLVTGDKDPLDIADRVAIPIVTPRQRQERLRSKPRQKTK